MPDVLQYLILILSFASAALLALLLYRLSRPAAGSGIELRIETLERLLHYLVRGYQAEHGEAPC